MVIKLNFVAIDVETANADMSSICQIGIAHYQDGKISKEWVTYIDPEDYFDGMNISIHGIDEEMVFGAPTFEEVSKELNDQLNGHIVVCHTHFDRVAIKQASEKYSLPLPQCTWLDSARVVRRTWLEFSKSGYGLNNICNFLGYEFKHHDALEDAKAAGYILISASNESGINLDSWVKRVNQSIAPITENEVNPDGILYGEILVFTGELEIPRREAAKMAAQIGCQVASGVTKKTTILVVGDQDVSKLAGHKKSSKHRKAEQLILKGSSIRIIRETDFKEMVLISD